jgi:hypothetical protein
MTTGPLLPGFAFPVNGPKLFSYIIGLCCLPRCCFVRQEQERWSMRERHKRRLPNRSPSRNKEAWPPLVLPSAFYLLLVLLFLYNIL